MLMPMFGLILASLVVGGLGTLVAIGDPQNARLAPYIGFTALFGGLGALSLSVMLAFIGYQLPGAETAGGLGLFIGYVVGGSSGAVFGFLGAMRRRARIESAQD
jgi:hypothetical protein